MEIESGDDGALRSDPNDGPDQVKVMTVHASKGLEFKHVFVVSLVDQRFPTREREDAIPLPDGLVREKNLQRRDASRGRTAPHVRRNDKSETVSHAYWRG